MMIRTPTPELVRFLVTHWPFSGRTLQDLRPDIQQLTPNHWAGFSRAQIAADIESLIEAGKGSVPLRQIAQPIVICLLDRGQMGKTTLSHLLDRNGLPVFSTDQFIRGLQGDWHSDTELRDLATAHAPGQVDLFIRAVEQRADRVRRFVQLFFDAEHGFHSRAPLSIIEGYLHYRRRGWFRSPLFSFNLEKAVVNELRVREYRVWLGRKVGR